MTPQRRLLVVLAAAGAVLATAPRDARAQNFFEQLFGLRPSAPPVPPGSVPGRGPAPPGPMPGAPPPAGGDPIADPSIIRAAPPAPPKPVVVRAPNDADVLGRDLMLNGSGGLLRLERGPQGFTGRVTLAGSKISQPTETCTVKFANGEPTPLADKGRPDGVTRLGVANDLCPLRLDILDGSVMGVPEGESDICTFAAQDCQVEPKGLWGPAPASLLPRAAEFEQARGGADKAVRDNYRVLVQRAQPQVRPVVAEQAAFSSEREQMCRSYARESVHGFCHLRFTEGRGLSLAARLGVAIQPGGAAVAATPRARRRPDQAVIEE